MILAEGKHRDMSFSDFRGRGYRVLRRAYRWMKRLLKRNAALYRLTKMSYLTLRFGHQKAREMIDAPLPSIFPRKPLSIPWPTREELDRERKEQFPRSIKFSILVPLYNTPESFLREMIESVQAQTYPDWELCLADGSDAAHGDVEKICGEYVSADPRVKYRRLEKNLGISGNTNACIEMAEGDFIALFDHDDLLHPSALHDVMKAICEEDADYVYTDETTFDSPDRDKLVTVHCKPDFSPDNLLANNYICHFSAFSARLLEKAGRFRSEYDGSQDHDMILRLTEAANHVVHIPRVLYWWRSHPQSVAKDIGAKDYAADSARRAVRDFLRDYRHIDAQVRSTRAFPTIFQIIYPLEKRAKVSIVIPNRDRADDLKRCVDAIRCKTTYEHYEIVIAEHGSAEKKTFEYYRELGADPRIRVLKYRGAHGDSRVYNWAVGQCDGEYVVLLNAATEIITPDWLENMMMYAQRKDVGAVGAKLYASNGRIWHAGIVLNLGPDRVAGRPHYDAEGDSIGYMGRLCYAQDVSAVSASCLMVSREKYVEADGLDEGLVVALNDVDFCLKLRKKGYLNIFTPFAELTYRESALRGESAAKARKQYAEDCDTFRKRWSETLKKGDPYFNPNFSLDSYMFEIAQE